MGNLAVASSAMRLYRGLKNPYRPELVDASRRSGTDFTDCPATALLYARSSRGVLLVVDFDGDDDRAPVPARVTKELWLDKSSSRFMLWGTFDDRIIACFPAKDLRARVRHEGLRNATHASKAYALRAIINDELRFRSLRAQLVPRSEFAERVSSYE
jgi:hypothetical protein